jgi:hypothetical protein
VLTLAQLNDREFTYTNPGGRLGGSPARSLWDNDRLLSKNIAGPANRWLGRNSSGYSNATADEIQDRLAMTIEPAQRIALHRHLLQVVMDELPIMPLRWNIKAAFVLRGVKGPVTRSGSTITSSLSMRSDDAEAHRCSSRHKTSRFSASNTTSPISSIRG